MTSQTRGRSLVWLGSALIIVGALLLLDNIAVVGVSWWLLFWGGLAAASGVVFVRKIRAKQDGSFWWVLLFCFSLYKFLDAAGWIDVPAWYGFPLVLFALAAAFGLQVVARPGDWHMLVPAIVCAAVGIVILLSETGALAQTEARALLASYWPVALLLFGAALLINSRRRR